MPGRLTAAVAAASTARALAGRFLPLGCGLFVLEEIRLPGQRHLMQG